MLDSPIPARPDDAPRRAPDARIIGNRASSLWGMSEASPAVEVSELVKRYPKAPVNAVDGISFAVRTGEVFGLLGPNGAGKTTTVGMLTTRVRPSGGEARVGGVDVVAHPVQAPGRLAVVPQRSNLDRSISIRKNLTFHAAYHGVSAADAAARADELP